MAEEMGGTGGTGGGEGLPAGGGGAGGAAPDWREGIEGDLRGYVDNKGWENPAALAESYRNLEKLQGVPADRLLKLPDADAESGEWGEGYSRLGRPENPDGYNIEVPEGADSAFADRMKQMFHDAQLPKSMAENLTKSWNKYTAEREENQQKEYADKVKADEKALRAEWGAAYDQNVAKARLAARELGMTDDQAAAMEESLGFKETLKFLGNIGSKFGEDAFVSGDNNSFGDGALTPEQAKNEIAELRRDPEFVKKYLGGDRDARREMERLHEMAYPVTDL